MSDSFSVERRKLMKALGAKVILTPAAERGSGMVRKAEQLAKERGWFLVTKGQFVPHKIQGWTPDFVPAVFNRNIYDEAVLVSEVEARDAARDLAQKEGIFCGISSGGTFAAAVKVAARAKEGSVFLAMLPDTGERYLTTFLFEGITEASDE